MDMEVSRSHVPTLWHHDMMLWSKNVLGHICSYSGMHMVCGLQAGHACTKVYWKSPLVKAHISLSFL